MENFKLNVCAIGHPLNVRTWSSTPFNICKELKKSKVLGNTYDATFNENRLTTFILKSASAIYYRASKDISRGKIYRYYRSARISNLVEDGSHTLHFGTSTVPFLSKNDYQFHYLYTDYTWDLWAKQSTDMKGYPAKLLRDAHKLEFESYRQFTHIFSISEFVKENLIAVYGIDPEKITVVGTGRGVLSPYFEKKDYTNGKILFAAKGRFTDKGGEMVLQAFEKAVQQNPNLHLTVVGQNEYSSQINKTNVTTLGFVPLRELQDLFDTHSLFIMPAKNEPWGLVYIEALACKMPIIGLRRNAFPEISGNGEYGYIIDSSNPQELADLIHQVTNDPVELAKKGLAGQHYCLNKFTWENVTNTIVETIEQKYISE